MVSLVSSLVVVLKFCTFETRATVDHKICFVWEWSYFMPDFNQRHSGWVMYSFSLLLIFVSPSCSFFSVNLCFTKVKKELWVCFCRQRLFLQEPFFILMSFRKKKKKVTLFPSRYTSNHPGLIKNSGFKCREYKVLIDLL